jgi:hypothetical protein
MKACSVERGSGFELKTDAWFVLGMTTLEIAILADCKKFISHRPVQRIINGM